jgi:hypothetical protein
MGDFLRFETMITPVLIQVVFWIAVFFCVIGGIIMMVAGGQTSQRVGGLFLFILGPIGARIYAEIFIIWFRMNDHLRQIEHNTQRP